MKKDPPHITSAQLRQLVSANPAVTYVCEAAPPFAATFIAERVKEQLGWEPQDFLSDPRFWADHIHPDDRERVFSGLQALFDEGHHVHEYRFQRKDGGYRWMRDELRLTCDQHGEPREIVGFWIDITERKRMEEALQRSEASLANAQRIAHLGNWEWDIATNSLHWSDEIYRIFGLEPQQFGATLDAFLETVHADDRESVKKAVERALYDKVPYSIDHRIVLPDGQEKIVHEQAEVEFDEDGKPVRMSGTVQDITVRIVRLKKLSELSMTLSGDPIDVFKHIAHMIGELFNVRTVCLSEIRGDELYFLSVYVDGNVFVDAGNCPLGITPCATVEQTKDIRVYEHVSDRFPEASFLKDHNAFSYCGFPSLDNDGNVVAITCLLDDKPHDFTAEDRDLLLVFGQRIGMEIERHHLLNERKRAEEELHKLSRVVEQSSSMIQITDTKGRIEYVNPKFTEVTGYAPAEAIGRTPAMLKSGTTPSKTYKDLWETLTSGNEWHADILNRKRNGEFYWCRESISPIRDASGQVTHFLAIEEDITERRKIDEHLREAQKMEAVGQLTGGIAHDFNNLLTVIGGNLELLAERVENDDGLRKLVATAEEGARRAAELTQKLLAFSRRQPLHPEVINLGELVSGMTGMLRCTLGETIEVETVIPEGLWQTRADPGQVENALLNLAINARDAMPKGGSLTIETADVRLDDVAAAKHADAAPGDYVMLAVTDTGSGMPPEVVERVFEPFFTTKEVGKGTGLGLSMVYGFARQSGGFVDIESEPGKGTRVELYLPTAEAREGRPAEADETRKDYRGQDETVLVVEDDKEVRALAVSILTGLGYHVLEAENGPAALAVMDSREPVDLLFTDLVMPGGMNGRELAEEARRRNPGLRVLFTSGYIDEWRASAEDAQGRPRLIDKPYRRRNLARAVREILEDTDPIA
ncbi:MAG: PAS domain-containing protein [Alphaproteobacteria bacterium]